MSRITTRDTRTPERAAHWRDDALCATDEYDGRRDMWFPHQTDHTTRAEAKRICALCPVRVACLVDALREEGSRTSANRHGIRGGLTPKQRRNRYEAARKKQKRAAA